MDDIFVRKREIQEKLLKEKERSELIKGSLVEADTLTSAMVSILNQFDERLHKLEDTILPLHRKTKDLQRLQDNIDKTVNALDHVIDYHHVAHDVETQLRQGPSGQVGRYLKCMERLEEAISFFSENNPDSPELNTVNSLFKNGKDRLEKEFHSQLSRQTRPLPATKVLQLIQETTSDAEASQYFPEKTIEDLTQIAQWLSGPGKSQSFTTSYSEIRSKNLVLTLEELRDHVKGFIAPLSVKKLSIANTPKKTGSRRPSNFARKTLLRKESLQSLGSMGGIGKSSYAPINEEESIEIDVEPFINMLSGCAKLLAAERIIMQSIIPDKNKRKVFDTMISEPLNLLEMAGNKFVAYAKQCIATHDHPSIVNLFPVIKHLKGISPTFLDILKGTSEMNRTKLSKLIAELETIGVKVLEDFTDCVKSDPEKESNMPKDGTVHELTSNAMLFMQQLSQNADVAGGMLATMQLESPQSPHKMRQCLAQYISFVLGALKLNLENKSRVYDDDSLAAVFLLNNFDFILSALDRHGLLGLVELHTPEVEKLYNGFIGHQKVTYMACWDKFDGYLSNESKGITVDAQPGMKLKDKEKQIVKDKFKGFNGDLDELVRTQQQWAMPNQKMKKEIRASVKRKIVPSYTRFHEKYRMVQFTKNIEKYLKYTAENVEERIEKLFAQCAS